MMIETEPAPRTRADSQSASGLKLRSIFRDGSGDIHLDWPGSRLAEAIGDHDGTLWVDLENPDESSLEQAEALLRTTFGFHPLAVEDALQESHIPKIDDWGEYIYLVFHGTSLDSAGDELKLHELDVFLGPNFLVTYHAGPLSFLDQDRRGT